ncbi:MAG: hypothetical protein LBR35_00355 [Rickettsiales bacterium]|jgi:transcription termination factor NusB|nr:hypothetical protein [Rickettsiales bacterium]
MNDYLEENLTSRLFAVQKVYGYQLSLDENDIKALMFESVPGCGNPKNLMVNRIYKAVKENYDYLKGQLAEYDIKDTLVSSIIYCAVAELIYLKKDIGIIISQYQKIASFYYDDGKVKLITSVINKIWEQQ